MPSSVESNWGCDSLLLLLGALASCAHQQGGDGVPLSTAKSATEDTLAAPPSPDPVEVAAPSTDEPMPMPVEQPLLVRGLQDSERANYEEEIASRPRIEVTKASEPELWGQLGRLKDALGTKGELVKVLRSEDGVIEYRTLTRRFLGAGNGYWVRAMREGDGWLILSQGGWVN